ncbi:MAG: universal stress protein [Pseudomonadota bacterium]
MSNKIIALVDGSEYSASVCDYAAWVSQRTDAAVELLHVLGPRPAAEQSDLSGSIKLGARTALMKDLASLDEQRAKLMTHRGRAILEDAHSILISKDVTEITTRLRHGELIETVQKVEHDAKLIMIGKRGETAASGTEKLGSNFERMVRASRKPVFVAAREFKPVKAVLVAYDGGPSAIEAIDFIVREPLFQGLSILVATAGGDKGRVRDSLADAQAKLKSAGFEPTTSIVDGNPGTALAGLVAEADVDMIVMGAYSHSRIRTLVIGSTTSAMIAACKVPIVLVQK